jgi:hypothetical protein
MEIDDMENAMNRFAVVFVVSVAWVGVSYTAAAGPTGTPHADYTLLAKLPDWSGVWAMPDQERGKFLKSDSAAAPYLAGYAARSTPPKANSAMCLTTGMPGVMAVPLGFEFLFTPGRVTLLAEEGPTIRRIYTDGRGHEPDPEPTYSGDSIGHWEGDTLVIDTVGIREKSEYFRGIKTSGQAHVVERIRKADQDHMLVDTVIVDPGALSKPWHYSFTYRRSEAGFIESYYCDDNRDANGEPDLAPRP